MQRVIVEYKVAYILMTDSVLCMYCTVVSAYREEAFKKNLWEKMSSYFFENIYIPAAQADNTGYQLNFTQYLLHIQGEHKKVSPYYFC